MFESEDHTVLGSRVFSSFMWYLRSGKQLLGGRKMQQTWGHRHRREKEQEVVRTDLNCGISSVLSLILH